MPHARRSHLLVAVLATAALVLQAVLVVRGGRVLDEVDPPDLPIRLLRFVAYFTVQSNLLVAVTAWLLVRAPDRDGTGFRVARLAAISGITVTGLVHLVLLRPLLDLDGADRAADKMLHVVVPVAAVAVWCLVGPRPRSSLRTALLTMVWPVAWLVETLVVGAASGWYPYPFLDPGEDGTGAVVVSCAGVTVLFVAVVGLATYLDRRLTATADSTP